MKLIIISNMGNNQKMLLALLAGAAAGAALGLLFAPERGKDTRRKIIDSAKKIKDAMQEKAEEQLGNLNEVKEKIYSAVK